MFDFDVMIGTFIFCNFEIDDYTDINIGVEIL